MRSIKHLAIVPAAIAACALAAGCFSYHKNVDETKPAVVETAPPAVVTVPEASSSTTTTTTDSVPGVIERQRTATYSTP